MNVKLNDKNEYKKFLNELCRKIPLKLNYNCVYSKKKIFAPLVYVAVENSYLESINDELPSIPNSDTIFYHIKKLKWEDILKIFQEMVKENYIKIRKIYRLTGKVRIAIDFHDIPYYGKDDNPWIVSGKQKGGTNKFLRIATADVVKRGRRFTLAVIPINPLKTKREVLEDLVYQMREIVDIECILMDRGFESIEVYKSLNKMKKKWITPVKKSAKIMRIMDECAKAGVWETIYRLQCNKEYIDVRLLIYPTKDGDLVGFFTNMDVDPEWVAMAYPDRWGIETGYRVKKEFRGKTCSRNFTVRLFFLMLSILLYNFWVAVNVWYFQNGMRTLTVRKVRISLKRVIEDIT